MIHLFNTTIMPTVGVVYRPRLSSVEEARRILAGRGKEPVQSAIGHDATARLATELFGFNVALNRVDAAVRPGDRIVAIKLRSRPPEGQILSRAQMEAIGYDIVVCDITAF